MIPHYLKVLEFDRIRDFLKSFASSAGGRAACGRVLPQSDPARVRELLQETLEMRGEIECSGPLSLSGIHDIRTSLDQARIKNFYLEPARLVEICDMLETAGILKNYFAGLEETRPLLHRIAAGFTPLDQIPRRIRASVSGQGEILDSASPALADIRRQIRKLRSSIIRSLEQMLTSVDLDSAIQDDFITLRNNRYVIPVRSDSKNSVPGVVHDQSQSKATFFVEPLSVVNQNNELQGLRKDEYYEEIRILTELTGLVDQHGADIRSNLELAEQVDVIHARALFARALAASCPEINEQGVVSLRACRHPILLSRFIEAAAPEGENAAGRREPAGTWVFDRGGVVPIDCLKGPKSSALIITGANAGGKTVAMKTIGLFVLMTQAGMHIPVAPGSTVALFDRVFADIGDEQNMEASLSTFSAHMGRVKDIVTQVTASSLVLLDELGSGTDPSEGGALAVAILDFLRGRGCTTIVTTHLNILKTYAYTRPDVENVSVGFDPATRRPNYSLIYGIPGFSNAIEIARSMGIPEEILNAAGGYLEGADRQVAELIHGLEKTQTELAQQKDVLRGSIRLGQRFHRAAESLHESLKEQREKILRQFETEARRLLRRSQDELMKLLKEQKKRTLVRPEDDFRQEETAREKFAQVKKKLHDRFPAKAAPAPEPVAELAPGQTVLVVHLGKQGTVLTADNAARKAEVEVGNLRVKAKYSELARAAAQPTARQAAPKKPAQPAGSGVAFARKVTVIGMRVEDALPVVDKAIDIALLEGADTVEIIHGRGTGRLMAAIHEHLKQSPYVEGFNQGSAEEGGSGLTIVKIK